MKRILCISRNGKHSVGLAQELKNRGYLATSCPVKCKFTIQTVSELVDVVFVASNPGNLAEVVRGMIDKPVYVIAMNRRVSVEGIREFEAASGLPDSGE